MARTDRHFFRKVAPLEQIFEALTLIRRLLLFFWFVLMQNLCPFTLFYLPKHKYFFLGFFYALLLHTFINYLIIIAIIIIIRGCLLIKIKLIKIKLVHNYYIFLPCDYLTTPHNCHAKRKTFAPKEKSQKTCKKR